MRFLISEKLSPHKYKTPEGYLICTDAVLSRTGKQEYRRCELFGDACDNAEEIVQVNREDSEVFSDKAMASFENKPVCIQHPDVDVNSENHNELAVGFVRDIHKGVDNGQPVMLGTLVITNKEAVDDIESGKYKELSCGYDCDVSEDDLSQRNIRGNHVALCEQGRAGIARIVDSVDDAKFFGKTVPYEVWLTYPKTGRRFMAAAYMTAKEARENSIQLRKEWANNKDGIPNIEIKVNDDIDNKEKTMKDADFSKKSKQGYDVIEMYRDRSRLHAILKRANDYVVAYGYDTTDGTWAQGRYVDKYANAKATLFEEKPYAKKIQDAIEDDTMTYKKYNDKISSFIFDKKKLEAIVKEIQSEPGLLGGEKSALIMKANSYINDLERMEDSVYTVKYTKDDVTYIRKVKANSMSDAIAKATHD